MTGSNFDIVKSCGLNCQNFRSSYNEFRCDITAGPE